jgi:hypothetical protein
MLRSIIIGPDSEVSARWRADSSSWASSVCFGFYTRTRAEVTWCVFCEP